MPAGAVAEASRIILVLVGLAWLILLAARPAVMTKAGWAASSRFKRWQNPWLWALVVASALVLAGRLLHDWPAAAALTVGGNSLWILVFGKDLATLLSGRSQKSGYKDLLVAFHRFPKGERVVPLLLALVFIGVPLFMVADSLRWAFRGGFTYFYAAPPRLVFDLQLMLLFRAMAENVMQELGQNLAEWSAPGSLIALTVLLISMVWTFVSFFSATRAPFEFGGVLMLALNLTILGWGDST